MFGRELERAEADEVEALKAVGEKVFDGGEVAVPRGVVPDENAVGGEGIERGGGAFGAHTAVEHDDVEGFPGGARGEGIGAAERHVKDAGVGGGAGGEAGGPRGVVFATGDGMDAGGPPEVLEPAPNSKTRKWTWTRGARKNVAG